MKLTKKDIENLAHEIEAFLVENDIETDTSVYYNNKCDRSWVRFEPNGEYVSGWDTEENVDPHNYFEYAAWDHILSMSFEGGLYDVLNRYGGHLYDEFNEIFSKRGLYFEMGNSWNLTACSASDMEIEYTYYEQAEKTIHLYLPFGANTTEPFVDQKLNSIMRIWRECTNLVGDVGSCVLGAGFNFRYRGTKYFMGPPTSYQGSVSWETHKDFIERLLTEIGAEEITYDYGTMD